MTNIENNQKFYQFLKQHDDWQTSADTNGDGAITKSEFRKFLENNGFDFASLEGWNGENVSKSTNDLVGQFWNSINTNNANSKIKGTKVRNSAALDEKEQAVILKRIEVSEILEEFIANDLEMPSFVTNQDNCKKEIQEKLMELIEKNYLKTNKDISNIDTFLENQSPKIVNQVAAQQYASDQIADKFSEYAKNYNYKFDDDATLKGMIDKLLKNIDGETEESEITQAIDDLLSKYIDTLNGIDKTPEAVARKASFDDEGDVDGADDDTTIDDKVWYNPNSSSGLNDLQKAVLETALKKNMTTVLNGYEPDYTNYKELYDKASDDFIASVLKKTTCGEFTVAKAYGKTEFEKSDFYKELKTKVTVEKNFNITENDAIYNSLKTICETVAKRFMNGSKELAICKEIKADVMKRALAGEFDTDGQIDVTKVQEEIVKQVKANLAKLFPSGYGDLKLSEVNDLYGAMIESADAQDNDDAKVAARKEAAINYCAAMASRNTKFKEIVEQFFTADYTSKINSMLTMEIDEIMTNLQERLKELGDAQELKEKFDDTTWNVFPNGGTISLGANGTKTFQLNPKFKDTTIGDTSRFTYSPNDGSITVDANGTVTIHGSQQASYTKDIIIYLDGVEIARKTITVKKVEPININTMDASFNGTTIQKIMNGEDNHYCLTYSEANGGTASGFVWGGKDASIPVAKAGIKDLVKAIKDAIATKGANAEQLEKAYNDTVLYFSAMVDAIGQNIYDGSTSAMNQNRSFDFTYLDSAGGSHEVKGMQFVNNTYSDESDVRWRTNTDRASSGISVNVSYQNTDTVQWEINTAVVLKKFMEFYNAGL